MIGLRALLGMWYGVLVDGIQAMESRLALQMSPLDARTSLTNQIASDYPPFRSLRFSYFGQEIMPSPPRIKAEQAG